jgi:hypothetical protein
MTEDEKAQQLVNDYKQTFLSEAGMRVKDHMKKMARFDVVIVPQDVTGRIDALEVMRQEGMRSVIIGIETMLKKKPDESKGIQNEQ